MEQEAQKMVNVLVFCERDEAQFKALFGLSGLVAVLVRNADDFFMHLEAQPTEVILLANDAPPERSLELVARLRQAGSTTRDIPIVVVFPQDTPRELALLSLYQGAYDFLIEPYNEIELLTKITVLAKIKFAEDEFRRLAIRDTLTGLYDRRYLYLRLDEELSRAKRYSKPLSIISLDIDNFKQVNEQFGAEVGDSILQQLADELRRRKREIDVLARKEQDQFTLVLYNTDQTGALVLANRLMDWITALRFEGAPDYELSISMGLASVETSPELQMHGMELLLQSELAMAKAKQDGGGRLVTCSDDEPCD